MHRMVRQGRPCGMNPNPHGQIRASHGWFGRHTMGRRFVGAELKASYYTQAVANLAAATAKTEDLFAA